MPSEGLRLEPAPGGFSVRHAVGPVRKRYFIPIVEEPAALERAKGLKALGEAIQALPPADIVATLEEAAKVDGADFRDMLRVAGTGPTAKPKTKGAITFRELGEEWTSGRLHKHHPDYVKHKKSSGH